MAHQQSFGPPARRDAPDLASIDPNPVWAVAPALI
jgi:hypothetical protein